MIAGAEAGLLHLTGERGGGPVRPGLGLTDLSTGLFMHGAIVSALYARERTGRGQKIDGSLFETQVALLTNVGLSWLNMRVEAERWGTQHPSVVPYDAFKTKDLYFVCGATNDKQFATLVKLLGKPELAEDARFLTNPRRVDNREELFGILNEIFASKTTDEWLLQFEGSGMPYSPVNTMQRVFEHPQTEARDMVMEIPFEPATAGKISLIGMLAWAISSLSSVHMHVTDNSPGPAIKFSDTKASIRTKPPTHGEHTDEVLAELGLDENQRNELRMQGTIK